MKKNLLLLIILLPLFSINTKAQEIFSKNGYPEHFIAGALISATTSYFVFKKTDNKLVAAIVGIATASAIGLFKEYIDPLWLNGNRTLKDFQYTALGGVIGASIVIPLKKRKPKKDLALLF
ncbi:MAG: hypothetical protein L3J08_00820 [Flavobacteriaceae bacterium]|nr:hypothetical protein [Flavobacteriaceae bacterium]